MPIPLFKVFMSQTVPDAVSKTLLSGFITQGPIVDVFEKRLCHVFDHPYILTLNSATSSLTLALHLLMKPDPQENWPGTSPTHDIILSTPLTCTATNWAILALGFKIRWVDVDPTTCNMCLEDLERKINANTKVIYIVHWGGSPVDLDALSKILDRKERELGFRPRVVEDCAHGFMSKYDGKYLGTHGNICIYSLQAIKHMTTVDGGLIFLPNESLYNRGKLIRWFGIDRDKRNYKGKDFRLENDIPEWGYKFHMNDVNATIGICHLDHIHELVAKHKANASTYNRELKNLKHIELLHLPVKSESTYWIYTIKCSDVGMFIDFMKSQNIACSQVHRRNDVHSCVASFQEPLPNLDELQDRYVCIPVGWWMNEEDVLRVISCVKEVDSMIEKKI